MSSIGKIIERVLNGETVDTKKYRYVRKEYTDKVEIQRIEKCLLDTTAVYSDWETVKILRL